MLCGAHGMVPQPRATPFQLSGRGLCRLLTASVGIAAAGVMTDGCTGGSCINSSSLNIRTERLVI